MTNEPSEQVPVESGIDHETLLARYDALLGAVNAGVCYLDRDGRIDAVNADFAALLGRTETAVRGKRLSTFLVDPNGGTARIDDAVERLTDAVERLTNASETTVPGYVADGDVPVEVTLRRIDADASGGAFAVAVVRERDETDPGTDAGTVLEGDATGLGEAEWQFESLVDAVEEYAIFVLDADGRVASWNGGARRIKGYDREEILGQPYATFYTEADVKDGVPQRRLAEAREDGSVDMQGWRERKDGSQFWANATLIAVRDDDGRLEGYIKVTRDMSRRRERRQTLREERDLFEELLETSPVGIAVLTPEGHVIRANEGYAETLGADREEFRVASLDVYDADDEFVPNDDRAFATVRETGDPITDRLYQVDVDGERRWICINASPLTDGNGDVERIVVTVEDVTEYKRQEAELERQRDELAAEITEMFERITDAFFGLDPDWQFTFVNERAEEVLDVTADEVVGECVWDLFDEDSADQFREQYEYAMEHQEPVNFEAYYEDPLGAWFQVSAYPSETGLSVYFRDVTQRKEYERELAESEERYRTLVENLPNGAVTVFDTDLRYTLAGGGAFDDIDVSPDDFVGRSIFDVFEEYAGEDGTPHERALDGEEVTREIEFAGKIYENHLRPIYDDSGEVAAVMSLSLDVDERKEHERDLEEYQALTHAVNDVMVTIDSSSTIRSVTPAVEDILGYEPEEVVGEPLTRLMPERFCARHFDGIQRYLETGERHLNWNYVDLPGLHRSGEEVPLAISFSEVEYEGERMFTGVLRDITERKEHERELRRYEQIVDTVWDGVYALDDEGRFVLVNDAFLEMTGYEREDLVGRPAEVVHNDEVKSEAERMTEEVRRGEREVGITEFELATKDGGAVPIESRFGPYQYGEDSYGRTGVVRDITDRKRREAELQTRISQQEAVMELGRYALSTENFDDVIQRASELVSETLGTDYCEVLDLDAGNSELLLRAGVGWQAGTVGETRVQADTNSQAGYTLLTEEPVVVDDLDTESRFTKSDLLSDHHVTSGITTLVGSLDRPWGILGTHDTSGRGFSENDVTFVQSIANIIANAVERERQGRELESQREQLAALNQLNRVVQSINQALVEKSSREEIETLVCDRLADTYEFAWIGEVGRGDREVRVRTESGVEDYLSDLSINLDDEGTPEGPTVRAIRTREMQVARNIPETDYAPGRQHAEAYGYEASTAIPIEYEGSLYGVLNIYSERSDAFDGQEGAVLGQLGDIAGHAINSVERKQALMSDQMVELEFYLPDVMDVVDTASGEIAGEIHFERIIATGDDDFLVYGAMTEDARETMDLLIAELSHFRDLRVLTEDGDGVTFELQLSDPPAITAMGNHGGRVASAVIEGGDYEMEVHLPQTADVREVVTALQERYPDVELVAQRRTTKSEVDREAGHAPLSSDLTDRQRAVLEAAFRSGFFEWPRKSTGEDIADSVGITASTLHQHLRAAERKLVGSYLDG